MTRNIRLFPTYSQKENQTTNHCLLILKMIYEENPKFLSEVLSTLLDEKFSGTVGVQFMQQKKGKGCIPDGEITQEPFSIFIETKLGDDFDESQLRKHLENLEGKQGKKVLIALGNFEENKPSHSSFSFLEIEEVARQKNIFFVCITFEQLLQAIQLPHLPKTLVDAITDLGEYFDENNLLPSWKYRLDVVSCKTSFQDVVLHNIYNCPTQGGSYTHRRSLYFGTYRNKCVEKIGKIEAVVDLESEHEHNVLWKNCDKSDKELKQIALDKRIKVGDLSYPTRVFVLSNLFDTDFKKDSPGGMQGSKQYFDINKLNVIDAKDLAKKLRGKTWENY